MTSNSDPTATTRPAIVPVNGRGLFVEFETTDDCPFGFLGDPNVVLFFISWAFSVRFGGMHELAQAALHMQRKHKVDLKPLLTYADRDATNDDERRELAHSWQEAAPLAASARATATALESGDEVLAPLILGYEHLAPRLRELATMCDWAAAKHARMRLSFYLD